MPETTWLSMFSNRCPRCGRGRVLNGLFEMRERCDDCGLVYEREAGQNWGAMVISYAVGAAIAFPLFFVLLFHRASPLMTVGVPSLVLAVIAPFSVRYSRLAWTHIMYRLKPPT